MNKSKGRRMEKKNQDVKPKSLQNFKPQLNLHQDPCPSTPQSSPRSEEYLTNVFLAFQNPKSSMLCVLAFLSAIVLRHKTVVENCVAACFFSGGWNSIWAATQNLHIESCHGWVLFWWKLISSQANRMFESC